MFLKKNKIEEIDYHDIDLDNIPKHIAFIMDVGQRKEKCHELMDTMKEQKQFVILL